MQRRLHGGDLGLVKNFCTVSVRSQLRGTHASLGGGGAGSLAELNHDQVLPGVFCRRERQSVRIGFCDAAARISFRFGVS